MGDLWAFIIAVFLAAFVFSVAIFVPSYFLIKHSCYVTGNTMRLETSFNLWTDCMVKIDGQFIPLDQYVQVRGIK